MLPRTWKRLQLLWRALSGRSTLEREMDEELRFHLENRAADLARSGMPPAEAARSDASECRWSANVLFESV